MLGEQLRRDKTFTRPLTLFSLFPETCSLGLLGKTGLAFQSSVILLRADYKKEMEKNIEIFLQRPISPYILSNTFSFLRK